jgi:hypothetical protein
MATIGKPLLRLISAIPVGRTAGSVGAGVKVGASSGTGTTAGRTIRGTMEKGGKKRRIAGTWGWQLPGVGSRDWYRCNASGRVAERSAEWVLKVSLPGAVD